MNDGKKKRKIQKKEEISEGRRNEGWGVGGLNIVFTLNGVEFSLLYLF